MKVKMIRMSGNPVDPKIAEEYRSEWKSRFDENIEKYGKFGPEIQKALDDLDSSLSEKYYNLTVVDVELPKTSKSWIELMSIYGNIMVSTDLSNGKIILVIQDQEF